MNNQDNRIIGYDSRTGMPIYSSQINGYDPNTGRPIYNQANSQNIYQQNNVNNPTVYQQNSVNNQTVYQQNSALPNANNTGVYQPNMQINNSATLNNQNNYIHNSNNNVYSQNNMHINQNNIYSQPVQNQTVIQNTTSNNTIPSSEYVPKKKTRPLFVIVGIILIFIVVGLIISISGKGSTGTKTFMIYMVGSDLESKSGMATNELKALNYKKMDSKNVKVVLIAGGSSNWNNGYIDKDNTSIYELTENGFEIVKKQNKLNMGDDKVLTEFLNYSYENYASDNYYLMFWNHGGAIMGSEFDELSNDYLSLPEMEKALSNSKFNKNNKIESVIFSTCLNGSLEMGNVFKDYSKYLIASEEISMSTITGSDFAFINDIDKSKDTVEIGRMFIGAYKAKMEKQQKLANVLNVEYNTYSTYSMVDLNNYDELNKKIDIFFKKIDVTGNYYNIARIRSNMYQYGYDLANQPMYDMVDLYTLVSELKNLAPNEANDLLKELDKTIILNYATNDKSKGISIYFPYNGDRSSIKNFLNTYDSLSYADGYDNFINDFNLVKNGYAANRLSFAKNTVKFDSKNEKVDFTLELTEEQVKNYAKAHYMVFKDTKDGYYLPVYKGISTALDGNTLKAKVKDQQLKVVSISNNKELIITSLEVENTKDYIKYNSTFILQDFTPKDFTKWKIDSALGTFILDKKTNKVNLVNILLRDTKKNLPTKVSLSLNDYTTAAFASTKYKILDSKGNYIENWESTGVAQGLELKIKDVKFEVDDLNDGYDYYAIFKIYDVNNNNYYSKLVKMN